MLREVKLSRLLWGGLAHELVSRGNSYCISTESAMLITVLHYPGPANRQQFAGLGSHDGETCCHIIAVH